MTGDNEFPVGERSDGGEEASGGQDCVRSGSNCGAPAGMKPTCRTLGSITEREVRRESMEARLGY